MRIGSLEVIFHRTVRVADGRTPSNLPPSLGRMALHPVKKFRKNCPESWDDDAYFMALHDVEAMWMSFHSTGMPVAALIGAGGVNALTGEKLGTVLAKENYIVAPPQPWLDGWKDPDGTVFQFVATPHKKGEGNTVAEQIIGKESKTGAIGIAVFEPKDPSKIKFSPYPTQGWGGSASSSDFHWQSYAGNQYITAMNCAVASCDSSIEQSEPMLGITKHALVESAHKVLRSSKPLMAKMGHPQAKGARAEVPRAFAELGIGKGGKIIQKIYPDPHGLEVWNEKPTAVFAVYLVDAKTAEEITGEKVAAPSTHESYGGVWFGLKDQQLGDVPGSTKFAGLKSAAFTGDTTNVEGEKEADKTAPASETVAAK